MAETLTGYALAFAAGVFFGASDTLVRAAAVKLTPLQNLLISLVVGTPLLWSVALATGSTLPTGEALMLYVAAGLLNFVLGRLLFYIAVTYAGATTAAILTSPTAAVASLMAWALLGEALTLREALGVALVVLAVYLVHAKPSGEPLHGGRASLGIIAGLATTIVFATTAILVRQASAYTGADPVAGAAISYTSALPIVIALNVSKRNVVWSRRHLLYMAGAGAIVAMAQLSRYKALSLIPVANAAVLMALFPLHTLAFTLLLSGSIRERPGPRHALAAVLAAVGVALVNA